MVVKPFFYDVCSYFNKFLNFSGGPFDDQLGQDFIYIRLKSLKNDEEWWSNHFSIMSVASLINC